MWCYPLHECDIYSYIIILNFKSFCSSSPYQETNKKEIQLASVGNNSEKLAPLADPEPVPPDVSFQIVAQNEAQQMPNEANKDVIKGNQYLEKGMFLIIMVNAYKYIYTVYINNV